MTISASFLAMSCGDLVPNQQGFISIIGRATIVSFGAHRKILRDPYIWTNSVNGKWECIQDANIDRKP